LSSSSKRDSPVADGTAERRAGRARRRRIVGLLAITNIAQATQLYPDCDGGVGGGTDNHAINVGLRMSW
jgi:hypothetical protein